MKKIVYLITSFHLFLVAVVIFHGLEIDRKNDWLEQPLAFLTAINYSAWRFGFFTPNVGYNTDVHMTLYTPENDSMLYSSFEGFDFFTSNQESANRFYGFKVHSSKDSLFLDLSSRSLCTRMLNLHPETYRIKYELGGVRYPKMKAFTQDSAIINDVFYETEFEL